MKSPETRTVFVIGGTSETAGLAQALASAGFDVLVSMATRVSLNTGEHPRIRVRRGRLDVAGMRSLVHRENCMAIVCAAHPYAVLVRQTCLNAAKECGLPLYVLDRPALSQTELKDCVKCRDHEHAAKKAFLLGRRVLLTTGSTSLEPYVAEARRTAGHLLVRVLPDPDSLHTCREAGIQEAAIIAERGPFSIRDNIAHIRKHKIEVLVTKNSGIAGGMREKIAAAQKESCKVIVVLRPRKTPPRNCRRFHGVRRLVHALSRDIANREKTLQ